MDRGLIERWREALLLPGETDTAASGLRELAEYFGLSMDEVKAACLSSLADSKAEWEAAPRETPEQILDFYRWTRSYIFEHVWWHATDAEANAANVGILDLAFRSGGKSYLDFGSGVGANAILFARSGFDVTLADVSPTMLDFARWRLDRRGLKARLIDLNSQSLPERTFDFATAVDVLEHVVDAGQALRSIGGSLKPGGRLVFNYRAGIDPERPMHILPHAGPVMAGLRSAGLRRIPDTGGGLGQSGYDIVERRESGGLREMSLGIYDRLRYSAIFFRPATERVGHPQAIYLDRLLQAVDSRPRWLDIGCGRSVVPPWLKGAAEAEAGLIGGAETLVGVDPDLAALRDNRSCRLRVCFDGERLPFADSSFDLITSNMVLEHVERPEALLEEIRRVLRSGGRFLALTPNWLDFVTIGARLIPDRFHSGVVSGIEGRSGSDVYRTWFRFNRPSVIDRSLRECGFTERRIDLLDHPDIYSHVPGLARIESAWHSLAHRHPALRGVLLIDASG